MNLAPLWLWTKKREESLTDISDDQEVIDLNNKKKLGGIIECSE